MDDDIEAKLEAVVQKHGSWTTLVARAAFRVGVEAVIAEAEDMARAAEGSALGIEAADEPVMDDTAAWYRGRGRALRTLAQRGRALLGEGQPGEGR